MLHNEMKAWSNVLGLKPPMVSSVSITFFWLLGLLDVFSLTAVCPMATSNSRMLVNPLPLFIPFSTGFCPVYFLFILWAWCQWILLVMINCGPIMIWFIWDFNAFLIGGQLFHIIFKASLYFLEPLSLPLLIVSPSLTLYEQNYLPLPRCSWTYIYARVPSSKLIGMTLKPQ